MKIVPLLEELDRRTRGACIAGIIVVLYPDRIATIWKSLPDRALRLARLIKDGGKPFAIVRYMWTGQPNDKVHMSIEVLDGIPKTPDIEEQLREVAEIYVATTDQIFKDSWKGIDGPGKEPSNSPEPGGPETEPPAA